MWGILFSIFASCEPLTNLSFLHDGMCWSEATCGLRKVNPYPTHISPCPLIGWLNWHHAQIWKTTKHVAYMCFRWGLQNAELVEILGGGDEVSTNGLRVIWDVVSYIKSGNTKVHPISSHPPSRQDCVNLMSKLPLKSLRKSKHDIISINTSLSWVLRH